jgi:hypothetical protein
MFSIKRKGAFRENGGQIIIAWSKERSVNDLIVAKFPFLGLIHHGVGM